MPVIKFGRGDMLRSQNLDSEKWYSWNIATVETKPTADKNGLNYQFKFVLIDAGELDGKELQHTVNVSSNGRNWFGNLLPIIAAANGKKVDDYPKDGFEYDTDELKNKKIDGKHILDVYKGKLVPKLDEFLPYKSSSNTPGF